jgi:Tol biopolymer transport system component
MQFCQVFSWSSIGSCGIIWNSTINNSGFEIKSLRFYVLVRVLALALALALALVLSISRDSDSNLRIFILKKKADDDEDIYFQKIFFNIIQSKLTNMVLFDNIIRNRFGEEPTTISWSMINEHWKVDFQTDFNYINCIVSNFINR